MIKLTYCLRKRPDLSIQAFHHYWLHQHAPLVHQLASAIRARKYIQSHTIAPELNELFRQSRDLAPAYDGITEIWWDNIATLTAGMTTPEGQAAQQALLEDERKFIDHQQSRVFITQEHLIFDL